ncbi:unnamed protein product [Lasius platythorax]|uniref:Uncharacterized protein n=1 Tax=Lasius platythorax TaxID=488582 RepID=A0AAV2NRJ5_9HYME
MKTIVQIKERRAHSRPMNINRTHIACHHCIAISGDNDKRRLQCDVTTSADEERSSGYYAHCGARGALNHRDANVGEMKIASQETER